MGLRALSLPGCACRGAFQFAVLQRLARQGESWDLVAGASSGSICAAVNVSGRSEEGPTMWRSFARTPVFSGRWLSRERSPFGMSAILRDALERFLPERELHATKAELLVATTHAARFARSTLTVARTRSAPETIADALVVHSNRARRDLHDVIVASCYIPVVYARLPRLDGEVHIDGGASDNTLLGELIARGADDITLVTPYVGGIVAPTLFHSERAPSVPRHVRLRILSPRAVLRQKRFDFEPGAMEEALSMPHEERIIEAW
jgi:predicted acylesterase/phospholipase RssA